MALTNMLTHKNKITYLYATPDASVGEFFRLKTTLFIIYVQFYGLKI
jgi:hypothetical protein